MNCILFGSGVYVTGSKSLNSSLGNVGAAMLEAYHKGLVKTVFIQSTSDSASFAAEKINRQCGKNLAVAIAPGFLIDEDFVRNNSIVAAVISLPDHLHYQVLHECASLGLHTITVKPFVETVAQAEEVIEAFQQRNLIGCVEFHKRFDHANLLLKNRLRNQSISRILIDYSQDKKVVLEYFYKWAANSNVFQYLGVHYVDLIHWMTGAEPVEVSTYPSGKSLLSQGIDVSDNIDVLITWRGLESDFISFHLTSWAESHDNLCSSRQKIQVLTDTERIESEQADRGFRVINSQGMKIVNPYFSQQYTLNNKTRYNGYGVDAYIAFFEYILDKQQDIASEEVDERLCTFSSALASVKVTEMVTSFVGNAKLFGRN